MMSTYNIPNSIDDAVLWESSVGMIDTIGLDVSYDLFIISFNSTLEE